MSNYTKGTNFATKDALPTGNSLKIVSGTEIDTEFSNIETAVNTKADTTAMTAADALKANIASPTFTGVPAAPTATAGTNTTQVATTEFVKAAADTKLPLAGGTMTGAIIVSGGVYLGGTVAANKLDDYESGTFTPTFVNIGTGTYAIQIGSYTKIGNQCVCHIYLQMSALGTASGLIVVGGLPFSAVNVANRYASTSAVHGSSWTTASAGLQGLVAPSDTQVTFYEGMAASGSYTTAMADIGTGNLLFSVTYTTS